MFDFYNSEFANRNAIYSFLTDMYSAKEYAKDYNYLLQKRDELFDIITLHFPPQVRLRGSDIIKFYQNIGQHRIASYLQSPKAILSDRPPNIRKYYERG